MTAFCVYSEYQTPTRIVLCVMSGFRLEAREIFPILGYYSVCNGNSWNFGPFKMGPIGCLETSVRNYHHTLRNRRKERSSQNPTTAVCHRALKQRVLVND